MSNLTAEIAGNAQNSRSTIHIYISVSFCATLLRILVTQICRPFLVVLVTRSYWEQRASLLGARTLGAPGIATNGAFLLQEKNAFRNKCIASSNKCLTSSNLVVTRMLSGEECFQVAEAQRSGGGALRAEGSGWDCDWIITLEFECDKCKAEHTILFEVNLIAMASLAMAFFKSDGLH